MRALPGKTRKETAVTPAAGPACRTGRSRALALAGLVLALVVLDRASKTAVVSRFAEGEGFAVIPGVFHVTRVNNTGAAFGILKGAAVALMAAAVLCVAVLGTALLKSLSGARGARPLSTDVATCLILAGAVGNLYDRWRFGYVIDFLDFRVWPVFNVADAAITTGVAVLVLSILFRPKLS